MELSTTINNLRRAVHPHKNIRTVITCECYQSPMWKTVHLIYHKGNRASFVPILLLRCNIRVKTVEIARIFLRYDVLKTQV